MASTVEPCETKPLGSLSSTLEMFDTFKSQDDNKDSDEESFHLPLLYCDDEPEIEKDDALDASTPIPETEDEILNKFETSIPETVDTKIKENKLLNETTTDEDSDPSKKESDTENYGMLNDLEIVDEVDTSFEETNTNRGSEEKIENEHLKENKDCEVQLHKSKVDKIESEVKENGLKDAENVVEDVEIIESKTDEKKENEDLNVTNQEKMETEDIRENNDKNNTVASETDDQKVISITESDDPRILNSQDITEDDKIVVSDSEDLIQSNSQQITSTAVSLKEEISVSDKAETIDESLKENISLLNKDSLQEHSDEFEDENNVQNIVQDDSEKISTEEKVQNKTNLEDDGVEQMEVDDVQESKENSSSTVSKSSLVDKIDQEEKTVVPNDTNIEQVSDTTTISKSTDMDIEQLEDKLNENDKCEEPVPNNENQDMSKKKEDTAMDVEQLVHEIDEHDDHKVDEHKDNIKEQKDDNVDEQKKKHNDHKETDDSNHKEEKSEKDVVNEQNKNQCANKTKDETPKENDSKEHTESNEKKDSNKTALENSSKEVTSPKNIECDDLLDISVIRDADEDNASAIAEIIETPSSEKSDNDEQDEKEHDIDDADEEQEDNLVSSDKDERMEFDDGNTNSCDQDTSTTDNLVSDSDNRENDALNSESESQHTPSCDDVTEMSSNQSLMDTENKNEDQAMKNNSETHESVKPSEESETTKDKDETSDKSTEIADTASAGTTKRQLSKGDTEATPVTNKKMRLSHEARHGTKKLNMLKRKSDGELKRIDKKRSIEEKRRLIEEKRRAIEERKKANALKGDKIKTLITFEKFMKHKNMGEGKLTRSDLEQFCLQKVCEALMHKTDTGELHQTIKKQEQIIDNLRKDLQQLSKQTRDLDIVNKKLMNELRTQNINQKPLVPLKITRSVGLQVKLNVGGDATPRRKPQAAGNASSPTVRTPVTPNPTPPTAANRSRTAQPVNIAARQIPMSTTPSATSPRKPAAPAPILTQALQTRPPAPAPTATTPTAAKRPPPVRPIMQKPPTPGPQASAPGVIDLTDEDDRTSQTAKNIVQQKTMGSKIATPIKIVNKHNTNLVQNKSMGPKGNQRNIAQSKTVAVGQVKTQLKPGMQPRTVATVPQSVRLTPAQLKNGITIPGSVVTSTAPVMYVVQPTGTTVNSAAGVQKTVVFNFQTTNGVLTSAINGSSVSVIPSKNNSSVQLKTVVSRKHPAPLPLQPTSVFNNSLKPLLPKPHLSIRKTDTGIILQWRMPYNLESYESIASYQLFAYQETNAPPSTDMWRKVGDVKALALPMACTLTQFADKNKYYFAVRSVDVYKRIGAFSDPEEISL